MSNGFIEVHTREPKSEFDSISRPILISVSSIAEVDGRLILVHNAPSVETEETYEEIKALIAAEYTDIAVADSAPDAGEAEINADRLLQELANICPHSYAGYARVPRVDGVTLVQLAAALDAARKARK